MFLGQETSGKVNKNSEKNLRVFKNVHFPMNSMFTAVAGIKVTVVLQRIYFLLIERKRTRKFDSTMLCLIEMTKLQEEV